MDIHLYTFKPLLGAAVQWDGSPEQALEILEWIRTAASDIPMPVQSSLKISTVRHPKNEVNLMAYELEITEPTRLKLYAGSWLVLNHEKRFIVYPENWFEEIYEPNAPIIDTHEKVWYQSFKPNGQLWTDTSSLVVLKQEAEKWYGPGELTYHKFTQKTTVHATRVEELESI